MSNTEHDKAHSEKSKKIANISVTISFSPNDTNWIKKIPRLPLHLSFQPFKIVRDSILEKSAG